MKQVHIDGVIGWDVYASDIRNQLEEFTGEDIDLTISSPGGSVYEGFAIYNAIKDFKNAGGKITARVIGLAASMATYIPLAADSVIIEDNAVWMIHNPWTWASGDHSDLRKEADVLEGLAGLLAKSYVEKTGKSKEEIKSLMDEGTYLFGEEIIAAGFADAIEPAGEGAEDKTEALLFAKAQVSNMQEKQQEDPDRHQLGKVAALLKENSISNAEINIPASPKAETTEVPMDRDKLKKEYPDLFHALLREGREAGIKAERERRNALRAQADADPRNDALQTLISEAIASGIAEDNRVLQTKIGIAIRDGKALEGENPPAVHTQTVDSSSDSEESIQATAKRLAALAGGIE
jgi:ATP-dependent protease ClpP protease subunit